LGTVLFTRVDDLCDKLGRLQKLCDGDGVLLVLLHAHVEGLEAAIGQEAVKRRRDGANCVLEEAQLGVDLWVAGDGDAHDGVRVPVDVLCDRVVDNVCSELERFL